MSASSSSARAPVWTRDEEKAFENAIALHCDDWDKIASLVTTKTLEELKDHYQLLADDVAAIEAGHVPLPCYNGEEAPSSSSSAVKDGLGNGAPGAEKRSSSGYGVGFPGTGRDPTGHGGKVGSRADQERKKGIPWTEEEHRLFLLGLDKFGKGDWRSISRNYVQTRTPTQVASHAQKYFIRLNSMNRDRRRSSIHDITNINGGGGDVSAQHQPITGQNCTINPVAIGPQTKHRPPPTVPGLGMYGAPMGHPVAAPPHMASAVGTPVMLPPGHHHPPYVLPVPYPMAPPTMHQ